MHNGCFEQFAAPAEIVRNPATPFVAELVGDEGRALQMLALSPVGPHVRPSEEAMEGNPLLDTASLSDALSEMIWSGRDRLTVLSAEGRRLGIIDRADILAAGRQARG